MLSVIIVWILFGGVAGWLASTLIKRNAQMGTRANIVIGIIGAIIGGFLLNLFGAAGMTGFDLYNLLVAILGAVMLLFLLGKIQGDFLHWWQEQDALKEKRAAAPITPADRAITRALMVWSDDGGLAD